MQEESGKGIVNPDHSPGQPIFWNLEHHEDLVLACMLPFCEAQNCNRPWELRGGKYVKGNTGTTGGSFML